MSERLEQTTESGINTHGLESYDILEDQNIQERLRQEIMAHDGTVRIFVHPFFHQKTAINNHIGLDNMDPDHAIQATYAELDQIDYWPSRQELSLAQGLGRLVSTESNEALPILMFEEKDFLDTAKTVISHLSGNPRQPIYFLPTHSGDPVTHIGGQLERDNFLEYQGKDASWELLGEYLESLGVKKIILGGQYFTIIKNLRESFKQHNTPKDTQALNKLYSEERSPELSVDGCVYETLRQLIRVLDGKVEIEISNLNAPNDRMDIQRINQSKEINHF